MSNQKKPYKIDKIDFGFSVNKFIQPKKNSLRGPEIFFSKQTWINVFLTLKLISKSLSKQGVRLFSRSKWNISRSIFFGRGIYFKYISSFSVLVIFVFGTFVYVGQYPNIKDSSIVGFSKFATEAQASEGAIYHSGGGTILSSKQNIIKHIVKPGETLSSIAAFYSIEDNIITVDHIRWANSLKSDFLVPGMALDIPPVPGTIHIVQDGDTVLALARKYKVITDATSPEDINGILQSIVDLNFLDVNDDKSILLAKGQKLIIPDGVIDADIPKNVANNSAKSQSVAAKSAPSSQVVLNYNPGTFIWPADTKNRHISQYFKPRHKAVDIDNPEGTPLRAVASGTIQTIYKEYKGGNIIKINFDLEGGRYSALYAHIENGSIQVDAGEHVVQGQIIARTGCTGRACTGPHVHFIFYDKGVEKNPLLYLTP